MVQPAASTPGASRAEARRLVPAIGIDAEDVEVEADIKADVEVVVAVVVVSVGELVVVVLVEMAGAELTRSPPSLLLTLLVLLALLLLLLLLLLAGAVAASLLLTIPLVNRAPSPRARTYSMLSQPGGRANGEG
jgi:hypothetical protein